MNIAGIEKTIIKPTARACTAHSLTPAAYQMIAPGDRIAVCLPAGRTVS